MQINDQCQQINGKLIRVSALLPDLASLAPLDYDTSKRADPEVLQGLMAHAKYLRVHVLKITTIQWNLQINDILDQLFSPL